MWLKLTKSVLAVFFHSIIRPQGYYRLEQMDMMLKPMIESAESHLEQECFYKASFAGAEQKEMDSLVLGTLFPSNIVCKLLRELTEHRRVILYGATGLGKSLLARQVLSFTLLKIASSFFVRRSIHFSFFCFRGCESLRGLVNLLNSFEYVTLSALMMKISWWRHK